MAEEYIGYLKYSGELVKDGLLDAKKAAQALIGFDKTLRFFIAKQNQKLGEIPFEIPVKIREGSWEALVPHSIGQWILTGLGTSLGIAGTAYLTTAANKLAENDFKDASLKEFFIKSFKAIQYAIQIGKHLGTMSQKKLEKLKFEDDNKIISIPNAKGEYLKVPKEYVKWFVESPENILSDVAKLVESEREMKIGVNEGGSMTEVSVSIKEKYIFAFENDQTILFPELTHGQQVELEGELTRGNEVSNTVGFKYKDHILTCWPEEGSIVTNKNALFLKCKIVGKISRLDEKTGLPDAKRPKIIFTKIIPTKKKENISFLDKDDEE